MSDVYHKPQACPKCCCSQDLPAGVQSCNCRCHPANWSVETIAQLRRYLDESNKLLARCWGQLKSIELITDYRMNHVLEEDLQGAAIFNGAVLRTTEPR